MTGSNVALVAPCAAEGFRIYSATTFTFQFANRQNEVAPTAQYGQAIGAAVNAEETASTDWWLEIAAPLGNPFRVGRNTWLPGGWLRNRLRSSDSSRRPDETAMRIKNKKLPEKAQTCSLGAFRDGVQKEPGG